MLSTFFTASRTGFSHAVYRGDTSSFPGHRHQQKHPGQGYLEPIPSQILQMAVMSLNGVLASFSGFVALPQPFGDTSQISALASCQDQENLVQEAQLHLTHVALSSANSSCCGHSSASTPTETLLMTACPSTVSPRAGSACQNHPMACHFSSCTLLSNGWVASKGTAIEMDQRRP